LAIQGAKTLVEILPDYLAGRIVPLPQDDEIATYAPKLSKEDGLLDFNLPARLLLNKINAYNPWPGAVYQWNGKRLKILSAHRGEAENCEPGSRLIVDGLPAICTGEGILVLDQVQADGKKPLPGKTFLNGAKDWAANS
jgi:methionyl-tRNA formyltransferase